MYSVNSVKAYKGSDGTECVITTEVPSTHYEISLKGEDNDDKTITIYDTMSTVQIFSVDLV